MKNYLLLLILLPITVFSQKYEIRGIISNSTNNSKLSYANIRVDKTTNGTAANIEGSYILKLEEGKHTIIASYLGFKADTLNLQLERDTNIDFKLEPVEIVIDEVTVIPGRNPAYDIIREAIKTKNKIKDKIINYKYSSYTKGLVKTTQEIGRGNFSLSTNDTGKLKITSIIENESRGFYKKPKESKHFIVARKQSANTPPFVNILTGGNIVQSFHEDDLTFLGKRIPSPISNNATSYYYYYIEKEIATEKNKVYQINFSTDNPAAPGFYGKLFIEDKSFQLIKADVNLNKMANPGGLFKYVNIFQQYAVFDNEISLPIDYRVFAEGNYLGLAKFGFELHTLMNNYEINTEIEDEFFEGAVISVLPDADKKDENYWSSIQALPNTLDEERAYQRIDSLSRVAATFGQDFSFLAPTLKINENFNITGPLSFYSFNKVQGSTLNLDLNYDDGDIQRMNIDAGISYGFSDKLVKKYISGNYFFGQFRTTQLSFSVFDKVSDLFNTSDNYNQFTSTILSLLTKYDFRDYYYSKGFKLDIRTDLSSQLNFGLGFTSRNEKSVKNNSDFSFFYGNRSYSENEQIFDAKINAVTASFKLDFRRYLEDGFFRRKIPARNYILFEGSALLSENDFVSTDVDFSIYTLSSYGSIITAGNWSLDFYGKQIYSNGQVPLQWLHALPGNISASGKNNSFRTLRIGEVLGDKVTSLFLRHNFQDDLFKLTQIPILSEMQLQLSTHLNMAISEISSGSKKIFTDEFIKFDKPFYELGFSLAHPLIPLAFEFTWKLNYRGKNNFVFGINSFAF